MARLLMVLSSISPLFFLWAIRGTTLVPDLYFEGFCVLMILMPNGFLAWRFRTARRLRDTRELSVGQVDDHRDHILVYLFAMLFPFYSEDLESWRNFASTLAAIAFIVVLFWHLNLHYMNLLFAVLGYRVFTVHSPTTGSSLTPRRSFAVITKRFALEPGGKLVAYRLSNTVYLEVEDGSAV